MLRAGYSISQIPAIILAEQYGAKKTLGAAVIGSSILTLFIPAVSKVSLALTILFRALVGIAQAGIYPSLFWIFPRWVPVAERTVVIAFVISGAYCVSMDILFYARNLTFHLALRLLPI
jgi:ACS family sodium-dependent inorganic phosphate cotransporter-like MFS transporter 1/2/3/4